MKKFLFAVAALFAVALFTPATSHAQKLYAKVSTDTLVNAETQAIVFDAVPDAQVVTVQAVVTKLTGTVAGSVTVQGSLDGINFADISATPLTLGNVANNTMLWTFSGMPAYIKYRLNFTTTGTMTAVPKGYLMIRKHGS